MLLKKEETDETIKAIYNSSNILGSIYDKKTSDLVLIFNRGAKYKYANVKPTDYTRFELSESQGKVFNTHIKTYDFEKLEPINPNDIIDEINELKKLEEDLLFKSKGNKLITKMRMLIEYAGDGSDLKLFTKQQLNDLGKDINEYVVHIK
jgi:hypothetical protein